MLDHAALDQEWVYFKQLLTEGLKQLSIREVLKTIIKDQLLKTVLPQTVCLANISFTVPVSTADCEQGFSAVKHIKTVLRNRLKTQMLDCLMRISVEGPELENFDFENAATVWGSLRNQRLRIT